MKLRHIIPLFYCIIFLNVNAQNSADSIFDSISNLDLEKRIDSAASIIRDLRNSEPGVGIELGTRLLKDVEKLEDVRSKARLFDEMGVSFRKLGEFNLSVKYHFEALRIMSAISDKMGQSFALHNIGTVYRLLKQYDIALDHLFESLEIKKEFNDPYQISLSLNRIGLVFYEKGDIYSAEVYMQKALDMSLENISSVNDSMNLANIYSNYGVIEASVGKYDVAEEYMFKALRIYKNKIGDYGIAQALGRVGDMFCKQKSYRKAKEYLDQGFEMVNSIKAKELEREFYTLYANYYKSIKDYKSASEYQDKFIELNDILSNEKGIKQITHSEFLYKLNEKIKENELLLQKNEISQLRFAHQRIILISTFVIILLVSLLLFVLWRRNKKIRAKNEELKLQQKKLEELNATQTKLFSIIAHDLRNPFNFLILSSTFMLEEYEQMNEEDKLNILSGIETVSKESNLLLSNLLEWAQLQTGKLKSRKENFALADSTSKNVNLLGKLADQKNVKIVDNISSEISVHADQDMIDTVFRNLITNSIKFSRDGETITISATEKGDNIEIAVKDEGIGIDKETLGSLFNFSSTQNKRGTANESGSGIGLQLCKELIEENGGSIWIDSEVDKGTSIMFTLPKTN